MIVYIEGNKITQHICHDLIYLLWDQWGMFHEM